MWHHYQELSCTKKLVASTPDQPFYNCPSSPPNHYWLDHNSSYTADVIHNTVSIILYYALAIAWVFYLYVLSFSLYLHWKLLSIILSECVGCSIFSVFFLMNSFNQHLPVLWKLLSRAIMSLSFLGVFVCFGFCLVWDFFFEWKEVSLINNLSSDYQFWCAAKA